MRLIEDPAAGSLDKRKHISPKLFYTRDEIIRLSILLRKVDTSVIRSDLLTKLKFGAGLVSGRDSLLGITLDMSQHIPPSPPSTALPVVPTVASLQIVTPSLSSAPPSHVVAMVRLRSGSLDSPLPPALPLSVASPFPLPSPLPSSDPPSSTGTATASNPDSNFTGTTETLVPTPTTPRYAPIEPSQFNLPYPKVLDWPLPVLPPQTRPDALLPREWHPVYPVLADTLGPFLGDHKSTIVGSWLTPCDDAAFLAYKFQYSAYFSNPPYPDNVPLLTNDGAVNVAFDAMRYRASDLPPKWFRHLLFSAPLPGVFLPYELLYQHSGIRGPLAHYPLPARVHASTYMSLEIIRHEAQRVVLHTDFDGINGVFIARNGCNCLISNGSDYTSRTYQRLGRIYERFTGSKWVYQRLFDDYEWQTVYRNCDIYSDRFRHSQHQRNHERRNQLFDLVRAMRRYHRLNPHENYALEHNDYPHWFDYFTAGCPTPRARYHLQLTMQVIYHFHFHTSDWNPRPHSIAVVNFLRMFDRALQSNYSNRRPSHCTTWTSWIDHFGLL
jgi:hypothetical protein